ncbi:MAG: TIR domain-containing protein [Thermomicrobiales bacterium]
MARKVFFSFHYERDNWRVQQIKNMGAVEGQAILQANEWESVKRGGDQAIKNWIDGQMKDRSCCVVLIGSETAGREYVEYEILSAWNSGKGVLGIYIHNLLNASGQISRQGANPFSRFTTNQGTVSLDTLVPVYDPAGRDSAAVYRTISDNIEGWVEDAITRRRR